MASFNKVILMGNLTRDPQFKSLPSGSEVCEFGMAMNRSWTDPSGQKREQVCYVDCKAMGKQVETLKKFFSGTKGKPLLVEGRLDYREWQSQTGEKRSKIEVMVENFRFVGSAGRGDGEEGGGAPRAARPPMGTRPNEAVAEGGEGGGYAGAPDDDVPF